MEPRLLAPPDPPVSIAQVVVDDRILRPQFDRALQVLQPLAVLAEAIVDPAQAIDDVAVVGTQLDGAHQHTLGAVEIQLLLDPGVRQVVHHEGLLGLEVERL